MNSRELIARRAAKEVRDGDVLNLGAGMPSMVQPFLNPSMDITVQSENGILGAIAPPEGLPYDRFSTDASESFVAIKPGGAAIDSCTSFGLIRGGHVNICFLGAMQVDEEGSLANWMVPGGKLIGMGGAMDLVVGAQRVIVMTEHCSKSGKPKLVKKCTFPLTGFCVASAIVTELGYFEMENGLLVLRECAPGVTLEEIEGKTEARFTVDPALCEMAL